MSFRTVPASAAFALLLLALLLPSHSAAQDTSVEWTQITRVEAAGALGAILSRLPGVARESRHGLHFQGNRLRSDQGSVTTIFDAENRRWITLDHNDQSYTEFSLDDLAESMGALAEVQAELRAEIEAMNEEMRAEMGADWDQARSELAAAMREAEASWDVQLRTDRTGESRSFGPATAQRHFVTLEIRAAEGFGSMDGVEGDMEDGSLVLLLDLWQSTDFPDEDRMAEEIGRQMAADPQMMRMAEETSAAFAPLAEGFSAESLALWDPRIAAAMRRAGEAMEGLEGKTLASTTHVAFVREGVSFDRDAVLAWEPETMGDQLRGAVAESAGDAAREAARGAVRGLTRGLLGRGGNNEPEAGTEAGPDIRPLFRYISEMTNIQMGAPSADRFSVPEGYRPVQLPDLEELLRERPGGR